MINKTAYLVLALLLTLIGGQLATAENYVYTRSAPSFKIAIIIDDIGYNIPLGQQTVDIPGNLTLAVLPKTPGAEQLAEAGYQSGKEIMLHAPMSNHNNKALGPGGLTIDMDKAAFLQTLQESIASIPHIMGVNNHMGSYLTTQPQHMEWLMEELKRQNLYFIDSLTNADSVALATARRMGVTSQQRNVFLDHEQEEAYIEAAFKKTLRIAKKYGYAIAIGHPYPETIAVLKRLLPTLQEENIELVHVSELLNFSKIN